MLCVSVGSAQQLAEQGLEARLYEAVSGVSVGSTQQLAELVTQLNP